MAYVKAPNLAVSAVTAVVLLLSMNPSLGQAHEVVLCKELVTLCAKGKLWPSFTKLLALAEDPKLTSGLGTITCEDSLLTAETAGEIGLPLTLFNPNVDFGALPILANLGLGCTGPCMGINQRGIHVELEFARIDVEAIDKYHLKGDGLVLILNCPIVGTCVYRGEKISAPITHTGSHNQHGGTNLPLASFNLNLARMTTHGGSIFCPSTAIWTADYVLYLVHWNGETGLAWPALDEVDF